MATVHGSKQDNGVWDAYITYSLSTSATAVTMTISSMGVYTYYNADGGSGRATLSADGASDATASKSSFDQSKDYYRAYISDKTLKWSRGTTAQTKTVTAKIVRTKGGSTSTSTAKIKVTVPALEKHTYSFSANGGSSTPTAKTHYYGIAIALPAAISRTGYTFSKWKGSNGTLYSAGASVNVNSSMTFTAQWTPIQYPVKFNSNGGSGTMANQTMTYGSTAALNRNTFTKTNYKFIGWATSETGDVVYSDAASVSNLATTTSGITLYAKWEIITTPPEINNLIAYRVTTAGGTDRDDSSGEFGRVEFNITQGTVGGVPQNVTVKVEIFDQTTSRTLKFTSTTTYTSGGNKAVSQTGTNRLDTGSEYTVVITASDSYGENTAETTITMAVFLVDTFIGPNYDLHMAIGHECMDGPNDPELLECGMDTLFEKKLLLHEETDIMSAITALGWNSEVIE